MKYCVLLNAIKNKAIVVSVEDDAELMDTIYRLIECDTVQMLPVYPGRLPKGFLALVDENTYGKDCYFNPMGSWLYGCDDHGQPIYRNAVIMKEIPDDFDFMTEEEAKRIADELNTKRDEIYDITMFTILCDL